MGVILFLLGCAVLGVVVGIIVYFGKRTILQRATQDRMSAMGELDKRYYKVSDDLKLIEDAGDSFVGKYKNATPEKISRLRELSRQFESGWIDKRKANKSGAVTQVTTVTTYELNKMMDEIEQLLKEVFS